MNKNNFKILITVVILTFLFLSQSYSNLLKTFDLKIIGLIQSLENKYSTVFYQMITNIADTYQSIVITVLLVFFLYTKKYNREALFLAITMSICGIAMPLLKNIFSRERPNFYRLIEISGYSFPSGHTTAATTMYLTLAIIVLSNINKLNKYFVFGIAALGIIIIGTSRIYLGVHYPTDVMAGICLGISIVSIVYSLYYNKSIEGVK
ncbi:phosphatase PAP2 family protein [Gemella sanguinis]